jgi:hypothetical protein
MDLRHALLENVDRTDAVSDWFCRPASVGTSRSSLSPVVSRTLAISCEARTTLPRFTMSFAADHAPTRLQPPLVSCIALFDGCLLLDCKPAALVRCRVSDEPVPKAQYVTIATALVDQDAGPKQAITGERVA